MNQDTLYTLMDELADEAGRYIELLKRLKATLPESELYADLDAELHASVAHLRLHAEGLEELLIREVEGEPEPSHA
jgi:hypothetical protein